MGASSAYTYDGLLSIQLLFQTEYVMTTADDIMATLMMLEDDEQRKVLMRFFKTGPGEYGEGDRFLGIKVPQTRAVVREARLSVPLDEITRLLHSEWHEARLCGLLLLVEEMKPHRQLRPKGSEALHQHRREVVELYLRHARQANNWDLVDLSCPGIVGEWLLTPMPDGSMPRRNLLDSLTASTDLWEQRIAVVSTLALIRKGQYADTLRIATTLLSHPHPLIHKAIGWMLREIGKRDIDTLRRYLAEHYSELPRTSLRYAIERMEEDERRHWLYGYGKPTK